jgi:hypothetical protein
MRGKWVKGVGNGERRREEGEKTDEGKWEKKKRKVTRKEDI